MMCCLCRRLFFLSLHVLLRWCTTSQIRENFNGKGFLLIMSSCAVVAFWRDLITWIRQIFKLLLIAGDCQWS